MDGTTCKWNRGGFITHGIPFSAKGVCACIPEMGTKVWKPLLELAEPGVYTRLGVVVR